MMKPEIIPGILALWKWPQSWTAGLGAVRGPVAPSGNDRKLGHPSEAAKGCGWRFGIECNLQAGINSLLRVLPSPRSHASAHDAATLSRILG